jgi:3-methyladenine DNA glycosylase/8-oxoguanine DNA glycosylase
VTIPAVRVRERQWDAGRAVDLRATLGSLIRGSGDPVHTFTASGEFWWACSTPDGDATIGMLERRGVVQARAWGSGGDWLLDRLPELLGEHDDWTSLDVSAHPRLSSVLHAHPGVRIPRTGVVLDALVPAVLEQRVTGIEARRAWRLLSYRFGTPAPGPAATTMRVPPSPRALLDIPTWEWHRMEVDLQRHRTVRAVATVAARLQECVDLPPDVALSRLRLVPGVGEWTAAETAQRALGHPDAISVGDYHLADVVIHFFTGRARGTDEQMCELLEPWAGQRQRVVRLIELSGIGKPRFGPRLAPARISGL